MQLKTTIILSIGGLALAVAIGMVGCPQYAVYQQRTEGEAELAKSQYSRQVQIQDAESKLQASKSLAQAEVERAKGVAEANKVIGNSLKENEAYLRWLYIEGLKEKTGTEVIYVPTEAGLPILEAGKRRDLKAKE
jgi:regulator of protease activity HflC (stomatin/prohibitin superfamily)